MRWVRYVAHKGETRNEHKTLVRKSERSRYSWEDNIRIYLRETGPVVGLL